MSDHAADLTHVSAQRPGNPFPRNQLRAPSTWWGIRYTADGRFFEARSAWLHLLHQRGRSLLDVAHEETWDRLLDSMLVIPPRFARRIGHTWPVVDTGIGFVEPHTETIRDGWRLGLDRAPGADETRAGGRDLAGSGLLHHRSGVSRAHREVLVLAHALVLVLDHHVRLYDPEARARLADDPEAQVEALAGGLLVLAAGRQLSQWDVRLVAADLGFDWRPSPGDALGRPGAGLRRRARSPADPSHGVLDGLVATEVAADRTARAVRDLDVLRGALTPSLARVLDALYAALQVTDDRTEAEILASESTRLARVSVRVYMGRIEAIGERLREQGLIRRAASM